MMKRALPAVVGFFTLCLSLPAQQSIGSDLSGVETISSDELRQSGEINVGPALGLYRSDLFSSVDSAALIHGLPVLTLLDGRRFPIAGPLGRMGMTPFDLFPVAFLSSVEVRPVGPLPCYGSEGSGGVVNLRLNRNYSGGEVGLFYGKSSGKYGREDKEAYIIGGVGNDKVHFTAGASYEESSGSGRIPQPRR